MNRVKFVVLFCLIPNGAMSADCKIIESDLDRLACYDKESGRTPKVEPVVSKSNGDWKVASSKSALTDDVNYFASISSNEKISCRFGDAKKITLVVRCMENKTSLYLDTHCHLASSEYSSWGHVEYRVDENKAAKARMDESTDNSALGLWSGNRSIPVIKQLVGGKKLIVRFTPYSENSITATFDITGIESAIEPIRGECKW